MADNFTGLNQFKFMLGQVSNYIFAATLIDYWNPWMKVPLIGMVKVVGAGGNGIGGESGL